MIGGVFDQHPWNQEVGVEVVDRNFAATRHFPPHFNVLDEIYQFKNYSSEKVHELMRIDIATVDLNARNVHRTDKDFAVAWEHSYGKGRVFYCLLGHYNEVWARPDIQKMWVEGIKWAMGVQE
jgi:type 1 glutamine amidotransferase